MEFVTMYSKDHPDAPPENIAMFKNIFQLGYTSAMYKFFDAINEKRLEDFLTELTAEIDETVNKIMEEYNAQIRH